MFISRIRRGALPFLKPGMFTRFARDLQAALIPLSSSSAGTSIVSTTL